MEDGEARRLERSDLFRVLLWRVDALLEAGFSPGQARDLGADLGVDVDVAVSMVRSGTAADVAALQLLAEAASPVRPIRMISGPRSGGRGRPGWPRRPASPERR